jgi:hypothetical protein
MERVAVQAQDHGRRWLARGLMIAAAFAAAVFVRAQIGDSEFRMIEEVQRIQLTEDLQLPEPEEIPELEQPEPEEAVEMEQEAPEESLADDLPPAGDLLGLDGEALAGADSFGLVARKGGRGLLDGAGNDIGCEWYASVLNSELNELLLPILQDNDRLLASSWSVIVKLWLEDDGAVDRFEVTETGDALLDRQIYATLNQFERVSTPPPDNMPQPVRLRLRCQA